MTDSKQHSSGKAAQQADDIRQMVWEIADEPLEDEVVTLRHKIDKWLNVWVEEHERLIEQLHATEERRLADRDLIDALRAERNVAQKALDGSLEQLEAMRDALYQIVGMKWLAGDEWDEVLKIANRGLRVLNPASDPLRLAEADADLAAGRARPASEVFADLRAEQNQDKERK